MNTLRSRTPATNFHTLCGWGAGPESVHSTRRRAGAWADATRCERRIFAPSTCCETCTRSVCTRVLHPSEQGRRSTQRGVRNTLHGTVLPQRRGVGAPRGAPTPRLCGSTCLLYTSDAADDL